MRKINRFLALGMSSILVAASLSGCSAADSADAATYDEASVVDAAIDEFENASGISVHSDTAGKEETVYFIMDSDGHLEQTIVSEWLKNPLKSTSMTDYSELDDISVVKGDANFSKNTSDNELIWRNDGSDIYYQGKIDKEAPVSMKLSYELDGKKVSASDLAGASGHLKINFAYTNNTARQISIDGKKQTIYQPFIMISGLMLDNAKAQNITVTNGAAINSGDNTLVFGIAMPGLSESLGLDKNENSLNFDIPDEVSVEADVKDFSLMMSLTLASNKALSQLGLDDITSIDDLKSDINKLKEGFNSIADGAASLNDGAVKLSDGVSSLSDGTASLYRGTCSLSDGANKISNGADKVNNGAISLRDALNTSKESLPELSNGVSALTNGADTLSNGFSQITDKNADLNNASSAVAEGLSALDASLNNEEAKNKLDALLLGSAEFSAAISNASDGLTQIAEGYNYSEGQLSELITALDQYSQALLASSDAQSQVYAECIQTMLASYKSLYDNVSKTQSGVSALSNSYTAINEGISTSAESISTITNAVGELSAGAAKLNAGVASYTDGVSQASAGINELKTGLNSLESKIPTLVDGINQLSDGASELAAGTDELNAAAASLAEGADKTNNGSLNLKNGVKTLLEGAHTLTQGTNDLKDGTVKFYDEGIQKLVKLVNDDLEGYYNRIKAIQDYSKEYNSYAGCPDGLESSVIFIYKTDEIK